MDQDSLYHRMDEHEMVEIPMDDLYHHSLESVCYRYDHPTIMSGIPCGGIFKYLTLLSILSRTVAPTQYSDQGTCEQFQNPWALAGFFSSGVLLPNRWGIPA